MFAISMRITISFSRSSILFFTAPVSIRISSLAFLRMRIFNLAYERASASNAQGTAAPVCIECWRLNRALQCSIIPENLILLCLPESHWQAMLQTLTKSDCASSIASATRKSTLSKSVVSSVAPTCCSSASSRTLQPPNDGLQQTLVGVHCAITAPPVMDASASCSAVPSPSCSVASKYESPPIAAKLSLLHGIAMLSDAGTCGFAMKTLSTGMSGSTPRAQAMICAQHCCGEEAQYAEMIVVDSEFALFNFGENGQSKQSIIFTTKITSQNLPHKHKQKISRDQK